MIPRLQLVTLRLRPETILLVDQLVAHPERLSPAPAGYQPGFQITRTQVLRHAITAGLDLLTDQEPLELTEPDPCPTGNTTRPKTPVKAATAS